jgi:hypothetical protein
VSTGSKACICCGEQKPLEGFYEHPQMADGHLGKCKACCRTYAAERERKKREDPAWIAAEKARHREKYRRLNYLEKHGHGSPEAHEKWKALFPEKRRAYNLSQHIPCPDGHQRHHWSYLEEDASDVIIMRQEDHYRLHQYISYDQTAMTYRTPSGTLLATREMHESYARAVLSLPF